MPCHLKPLRPCWLLKLPMMPAITSVSLRPPISFFSSHVWMTLFPSRMHNAISSSPVHPNRSPGMGTVITNSVKRRVLIGSSGSVSSWGWPDPLKRSCIFSNRCHLPSHLRTEEMQAGMPDGIPRAPRKHVARETDAYPRSAVTNLSSESDRLLFNYKQTLPRPCCLFSDML